MTSVEAAVTRALPTGLDGDSPVRIQAEILLTEKNVGHPLEERDWVA